MAEGDGEGHTAGIRGSTPDVFISYASQDAAVANAVVTALEHQGLNCWLAPRNVKPGTVYADAIVGAINESKALVLVLSANAMASAHVGREIERAASKRKQLIAFRIDTTPLSRELEYFLSNSQWIDVSAIGMPTALANLGDAVGQGSGVTPPAHPEGNGVGGTKKRVAIAAAVATALGVVVAIGVRYWSSTPSTAQPTAAVTITDKSIAVLPFTDMSEKKDQEYFADGMAEDVLDLLASIPGLKVIGRTSSFQFKGKNQDLRAIGGALGVNYVVEGSIRRSGERLRVTAQLINTHDGSHLWSDTYDAPADDALKTQDAIAANLVRALQVTVGADHRQTRPSFASADAYDLYLRGRHASDRNDKEGDESAIAYFQQVLESNPTSVETLESLASVQLQNALLGYIESHEGFEEARRTAQRVLQLDPNSSGAYGCLAIVHLVYDWDWSAAEHDAQKAVQLEPRNPRAISSIGWVNEALGRFDEAARLYKSALTLDPLNPGSYVRLSNVQIATGRLADAEGSVRRMIQISRTFGEAHYDLGQILLLQGNFQSALAEFRQEPSESARSAGLAEVFHALKRRAASDVALTQLVREHAKDDAFDIAEVYAYRGEVDQAFTWLERAYRQRDDAMVYIKSDVFLKNLHRDPRYVLFLRKMNLPE